MFILFGWGKQTRKVIGDVTSKLCGHCNTMSIWQLCIVRTWFTLFFIPVIPYGKKYHISCPNCHSYIEVSKEVFEKMQSDILSQKNQSPVIDDMRYSGKTETQINYLKQMEENQERTNQ